MNSSTLSWNAVGKQSIGQWGEWYVAMALVRRGLDVYAPFVDERGIDLIVRTHENGASRFIELQVKTVRVPQSNYIFFRKRHFPIGPDRYVALVMLREDASEPDIFLIPSQAWRIPCPVFVSRDYDGLKSEPEYGLPLTKAALAKIEDYRVTGRPSFEGIIPGIHAEAS